MIITNLIGNKEQIDQLTSHLNVGASCYSGGFFVFTGPANTGKREVSEWFSGELSDIQDIYTFTYDGSQDLSDFSVFFKTLGFVARNRKTKTYLLELKVPLTVLLKNALLKRFEDTVKGNTIIVLATSQDYLSPALISRSRLVPFYHLSLIDTQTLLSSKGYSAEESSILIQCFGRNIGEAFDFEYSEIREEQLYIYENFPKLQSYSFIEIFEFSNRMDDKFDLYLRILINWATSYMDDEGQSEKFGKLLHDLFKVKSFISRKRWIARSFFKYAGWGLPRIITNYGEIE